MSKCFDILRQGLPNSVDEEDRQDIFDRLNRAQQEAGDNASDMIDKLKAEGKNIFNDKNLKDKLDQFSFYRTIQLQNRIDKLVTRFSKRRKGLRDSILSYLTGTQKGLPGTRDSLELRTRVNELKIFDGFKKKLADEGLMPIWNSKEYEEQITNAIKDSAAEEPRVGRIGAIVRERMDQINELYKRNGVFIRTLDERVTRNFHVTRKMKLTSDSIDERAADLKNLTWAQRKEKSFQTWKNFTLPVLDKKKTFIASVRDNPEKEEKIMRQIYESITNKGDIFEEPKNIRQLLNSTRRLHWKDSSGKVSYNRRYGTGSIQSAIEREFRTSARQIAVLERLGVNPSKLINSVISRSVRRFPELKAGFDKKTDLRKINRVLGDLSGSLEDPDSKAAIVGGNIRAGINITKLGGLILSQLTDLAPITLENRRIYGGFLNSAFNSITGFFKAQNLSDDKKKIFGDMLQSIIHAEIGNNGRWFMAGDGTVGVMSKLQRLMFKLNGGRWWDKGHRIAMAVANGRHLAMNKDLSFDDMLKRDRRFGEENVRTMRLYNISSDEWDAIREAPLKMADGKGYILPESAKEVSDDRVAQILKNEKAQRITPQKIQEKKVDMQDKLWSYFFDRIDHGILRPSALDRQFLFQGTSSGTIQGQLMRMFGQFKLYGTSFVTKPIAKLIYGQGAETFLESVMQGKGDMLGMSQLIAYGTLLGYLSNTAKGLVKGVSPAPVFGNPDQDEGVRVRQSMNTIMSAFSQGAGAIYVDLLFGNNSNFRGESLFDLAGPAMDEIANGFDLTKDLVHGRFPTHQWFNFVKGNTPFLNTWYAKYPLDHFILNRVQNAIHPDYQRHKLNELTKLGQHYILPQ